MTETHYSKSEIEHIQDLLKTHRQNLYDLEEKKARYGIDVKAEVIHSISYEQDEIEKLEARLRQVRIGSKEVTDYDLAAVRQVLNQVTQYIVSSQRSKGVWLREDLYPTARILFCLLTFCSEVKDSVYQASVDWVAAHMNPAEEKPDALAMGLLALIEAQKRLGAKVSLEAGVEHLLSSQNRDGSWDGRYPIGRYYATSTAHSIQALRAYANASGSGQCQAACYHGVRYLERYFRSLDLAKCSYSDFLSPIQPLLLPHYEAWALMDSIPEIGRATHHLKGKLASYLSHGNIKAVSGILTFLLVEWRNFDEVTIREIFAWLMQVRNLDYGWAENVEEPSEPHHSAMIALPVRQMERLGDQYIPIEIKDDWSLPAHISNYTHEFSASAVIYRKIFGQAEIVLLRRHDGTWVLPKGHIENGETVEEGLYREIREETGFTDVTILQNIGSSDYLLRINNDKVNKNVVYFLARTDNNHPAPVPDEAHADARWVPIQDIHLLPIYYDDSRQALIRTKRLLEKEGV